MAFQYKNRQQKLKHIRAEYRIISTVFVLAIITGVGFAYVVREHLRKQPTTTKSTQQAGSIAKDEPLHMPTTAPPTATPEVTPDTTIPPITNGMAPAIRTLKTSEPVVFLGIDDGANKQASELQLMKDNHIKASLFLANRFMNGNSAFFKDFVAAGSLVENHTMNHKLLSKLSLAEQKVEICGQADIQEAQFGRRPVLFRPPGGDYNADTQIAAAQCGMRAVVLWIAKANGGSMQYQVGHKLQKGDIVLMHFRPEFAKDMAAFVAAEKAAGLHTELLEDWL